MQARIGVVVPCKDEAETIGRTIDSLVQQSLPPRLILVVDDGSQDSSKEIVGEFAEKYSTVKVIDSLRYGERTTGAGIVDVFRTGIKALDIGQYDFVCKFDSDLEFPADYLQTVIDCFNQHPRAGLIGGVCTILSEGQWILESLFANDHVRGALKCYRTEAYVAIDGLPAVMGWDTLDEIKLRSAGYDVHVIDTLRVKQHRQTHSTIDPTRMSEKAAVGIYHMRLPYAIALYSMIKRKFIQPRLSLLRMLRVYHGAIVQRRPHVLSKAHGRIEAWRLLKRRFGRSHESKK